MAAPADHAPAPLGDVWPVDLRVERGPGAASGWPASVFASALVHTVAIVGVYAGSLAWTTGDWHLIPPQPGENSAASQAARVVEVPAPVLRDASAPAEALTLEALPRVPEVSEMLPTRTLERSPIGELPSVEAPPVDAELPVAESESPLRQIPPATKKDSDALRASAPTSPTLPREKAAATISTLADTRADASARLTSPASVSSVGSSGAQSLPAPVYNPKPTYPPELLSKGIEGLVKLRVELNDAGRVVRADVSQSSGHAAFDRSALEIIYRWRFTATSHGKPTQRELIVPIRFGIVR